MSIPDMEILRNYVLTMACGHKRRTSAPTCVGAVLPCGRCDEDLSVGQPIVEIVDVRSATRVEEIGWLSPQAAAFGAYDEVRAESDRVPVWRFLKRWRLRRERRQAALGLMRF